MCTMNAKDRIQQYIDYKGISNSKFEIEVGLSNGYWRKTKSISSSVVEKILRIKSIMGINRRRRDVKACDYINEG